MRNVVYSLITATIIALAINGFTIFNVAPNLPRVVGRPDAFESRNLTFAEVRSIRLQNHDGSVVVRSHEDQTVRLQAEIKAYVQGAIGDLDQRYVARLVMCRVIDGELEITTEPDGRPDDLELQVNYQFLVPEGTDISVVGANGNVLIGKGCGRIDVAGRNTDIAIDEPRGRVTARSTNGQIRIIDAADGADVKTENGSVYVHMLRGQFKAVTTNGDIVAHVLEPDVNACSLSTQNGGITLVMPEEGAADVTARTGRGTISSALQVDCSKGIRKRQELRGQIGTGGTDVSMDTLNGNIWIARSKR